MMLSQLQSQQARHLAQKVECHPEWAEWAEWAECHPEWAG
jgi:hypothetical protein